MNLRQKIANDIRYQVEVVYFFLNFPNYKEKLDEWYKKEGKLFIMQEYDKAGDQEKKNILRDVIVPDILENEKYHFQLAYFNMMSSKAGRMYLNYLKKNEPKEIKRS